MSDPIGVINEQGFVAGDFGFKPISEQDDEKIKESEKAEKKTNN